MRVRFRGEVLEPPGEMLGMAPAPIAVVSDNGACFRGEVFKIAFDGPEPPLRHVRTTGAINPTNGVIEWWFGTLTYEHLFRGVIIDGDALDMEVHRFLGDRTPSAAYTGCDVDPSASLARDAGPFGM